MGGNFGLDDRLGSAPNWSLCRWGARALGQVLARLAHRHARPAGRGADAGDGREQRVLPEVVGLPPGDLLQQVRLGPAVLFRADAPPGMNSPPNAE